MKKYIIILLLISVFSCEQDLKTEKQLTVMHGLVYEGKAPKIILTQALEAFPEYAFNIEYYDQPFAIGDYSNIEISILSEGVLYKNFKEEEQVFTNHNQYNSISTATNRVKYFTDDSFIPEAGKEYTIEIKEIPNEYGDYTIGFYNLKSKTVIPEKIPIRIEQQKNSINSFTGEESNYNYNILFDDPAETKDYYYLSISKVESAQDFSMDTVDMDKLWLDYISYDFSDIWLINLMMNMKTMQPDDSQINSNANGFLFEDKNFNGHTKNFKVEIENYTDTQENTAYIVAELMHVSEEYYKYYLSIEKQKGSQQDIFSEPTQVYTNIENGLGVFAGATISTQSIKIVSKPE